MSFEALENQIQQRLKSKPINVFPIKEMDEAALPTLCWQGGVPLEPSILRLCFKLAKQQGENQDPLLQEILQFLNPEQAHNFAQYLFDTFLEMGAQAKHKHLLALVCQWSNDNMLPTIIMYFYDLLKAKRRAMAIFLLQRVSHRRTQASWSFVYECYLKHGHQVLGQEAGYSLKNEIQEKQLNREEWYDTLVPTLGFNGPFQTIEIKGEPWRIGFNFDFRLMYIAPTGEVSTRMPRNITEQDKFFVKYIQKRVRSTHKYFALHLHRALLSQRRWPVENWKSLFLKNPVWSIFTQMLVWGHVVDGQLQQIFIADDEGCLIDTDFDELEIETGQIQLLHVIALTEEQRIAWKTFLFEAEIVQPFVQLEQRIAILPANCAMKTKIDWYDGKKAFMNSIEVKNYLEKNGWTPVMSFEGFLNFRIDLPSLGLRATLELDGVTAWFEPSMVVMGAVFFEFGKKKSTKPLKELPPTLVSNILVDLEAIMG